MSMKNYIDTIGNRTRDLLTCSAVSQPTTPPRALQKWCLSFLDLLPVYVCSVPSQKFDLCPIGSCTALTSLCSAKLKRPALNQKTQAHPVSSLKIGGAIPNSLNTPSCRLFWFFQTTRYHKPMTLFEIRFFFSALKFVRIQVWPSSNIWTKLAVTYFM